MRWLIFVIYILVCLVSIYLMKHEVHFKFNNNAFLYLLFGLFVKMCADKTVAAFSFPSESTIDKILTGV